MRFIYQAKDSQGSLRSGELNVDSHEAATTQLRQQGLYVVSLEEAAAVSAKSGPSLFAKKITKRDIVEFASQLAVMVDAGVPISSALEGLVGQTDVPSMKAMLTSLQESVQAGENLSGALSKYPKHFDKAFVNLVKASEASGQLESGKRAPVGVILMASAAGIRRGKRRESARSQVHPFQIAAPSHPRTACARS